MIATIMDMVKAINIFLLSMIKCIRSFINKISATLVNTDIMADICISY